MEVIIRSLQMVFQFSRGGMGAGTIIDLVALVLVPGSSVTPTMASIETFYTITQDGESEITIPIPEYNFLADRLHLYHDNLFLF